MANITGVLGPLTGLAALGSVFVYIRQRQKIPRLSFDRYLKTEQTFLTGHIATKVTTYCVRVKDVNPKSEGEIRSCAGELIVNNNVYQTVWIATNKKYYNFVKEALLKLFDVDWKDNTVGFFNVIKETDPVRLPASYGS